MTDVQIRDTEAWDLRLFLGKRGALHTVVWFDPDNDNFAFAPEIVVEVSRAVRAARPGGSMRGSLLEDAARRVVRASLRDDVFGAAVLSGVRLGVPVQTFLPEAVRVLRRRRPRQ